MPSFEIIRRSLAIAGWMQHGSILHMDGTGFPASGTAGDGAGYANKGSVYYDKTRGTKWVNTGSQASPYWQPQGTNQTGMWGIDADFRETQSTALSDTTAALFNAATGLRMFGQGMTETDSGAIEAAAGEGGKNLTMTTTDEAAHTIAIGTAAGVYQPDTHGMAIVEAYVTQSVAITLRGQGIGFVGLAADAFDPPITCATTVATLIQDDLALLHFNVGYTATDGYKLASNKSDEAPTMTAQAAGVAVAAAGTFQLLRVEVEPVGTAVIMRAFIDKVLVGTIADALDEDEEASPILYIESTSAAVKTQSVKRFMFITGNPVAAA